MRPPLSDLPDVLTISEAASVLRLGVNQAYRAASEGKIPARRVGRSWRVPKAALVRWLDGIDVDAADGPEIVDLDCRRGVADG